MAVNSPAAYGMYRDDVSLQQVVQTLNRSGFDNEQICLMVRPRHHLATVIREANILNDEREASAITLDLLGWLMKLGAVVIPTVGFFIRSRTYLHALIMRTDSPALCDNSRALVGLGLSEGDAERFENELLEMGVLVYVACPEEVRTTQAVEVLRRTGAHESAALEREEAVCQAAAA
jgi:hypothetical protein